MLWQLVPDSSIPPDRDSVFRILGESESLYFLVVTFGFVCDVFFIVSTRRLLKKARESKTSTEVAVILLLNLMLAVCLILPFLVGPGSLIAAAVYLIGKIGTLNVPWAIWRSVPVAAYFTATSNILDVMLAVIFEILALALLLHRALWPLLNRTLFRLQHIGTNGRRAIMVTIGFALVGASLTGKVPELVQKIVEKLG